MAKTRLHKSKAVRIALFSRGRLSLAGRFLLAVPVHTVQCAQAGMHVGWDWLRGAMCSTRWLTSVSFSRVQDPGGSVLRPKALSAFAHTGVRSCSLTFVETSFCHCAICAVNSLRNLTDHHALTQHEEIRQIGKPLTVTLKGMSHSNLKWFLLQNTS